MRILISIMILFVGALGFMPELAAALPPAVTLTCADEAFRVDQNFFYGNMTPGTLSLIQQRKGMASCPDYRVREVQELLGPVVVPTEVAVYGAADGLREGKWLFEHTQVRIIHLVEVGNHYGDDSIAKTFGLDSDLADEVRRRTGRSHVPTVMVDYNTNVTHWQRDNSIGVIFWMFAGIMELNHNEKKLAIERAWQNLQDSGAIVVDVPDTRVNSPDLGIKMEGDDQIRFHFNDQTRLREPTRIPSLVWSPINRGSGMVDFVKLKSYFTANNRFRVLKEIQYYSDEPANERRRLFIFIKNNRRD